MAINSTAAWENLNGQLHILFDVEKQFLNKTRPVGYLGTNCTGILLQKGRELIDEFHRVYGTETSHETLCKKWHAKMRKPAAYLDFFSDAGQKLLEEEMVKQRAAIRYNLNTKSTRLMALTYMKNNMNDFCDFVASSPDVAASAADCLGMSLQDVQVATLLARISELSIDNEWGDNLTMIALCKATRVGLSVFKITEAGKLVAHPSLVSMSGHAPNYIRAYLVHSSDDSHWNAALPLELAHELQVRGGVLAQSSGLSEGPLSLVIFGSPTDGRCQFQSFFFSLYLQNHDIHSKHVGKIFSTIDSKNANKELAERAQHESMTEDEIENEEHVVWRLATTEMADSLVAETLVEKGGIRTTKVWKSAPVVQTVMNGKVNFYRVFCVVSKEKIMAMYLTGMKVYKVGDEHVYGLLVAIYYGKATAGNNIWGIVLFSNGTRDFFVIGSSLKKLKYLPVHPIELCVVERFNLFKDMIYIHLFTASLYLHNL